MKISAKTIDLGEKMPGTGTMPVMVEEKDEKEPELFYPCLCISGPSEALSKLPKKGRAMISFETEGATVRIDKDDKSRMTLDLRVKDITPVGKGAPEPVKDEKVESESAMMELMEEY